MLHLQHMEHHNVLCCVHSLRIVEPGAAVSVAGGCTGALLLTNACTDTLCERAALLRRVATCIAVQAPTLLDCKQAGSCVQGLSNSAELKIQQKRSQQRHAGSQQKYAAALTLREREALQTITAVDRLPFKLARDGAVPVAVGRSVLVKLRIVPKS